MSSLVVFINFNAYDKGIFILLLNCYNKIKMYDYIIYRMKTGKGSQIIHLLNEKRKTE